MNTTNAQQTKGPWQIYGWPNPPQPPCATISVKPDNDTTVEHLCHLGQRDSEHWQANARLLASAPEMFAALKDILGSLGGQPGVMHVPCIHQGRNAIAKAEGA